MFSPSECPISALLTETDTWGFGIAPTCLMFNWFGCEGGGVGGIEVLRAVWWFRMLLITSHFIFPTPICCYVVLSAVASASALCDIDIVGDEVAGS